MRGKNPGVTSRPSTATAIGCIYFEGNRGKFASPKVHNAQEGEQHRNISGGMKLAVGGTTKGGAANFNTESAEKRLGGGGNAYSDQGEPIAADDRPANSLVPSPQAEKGSRTIWRRGNDRGCGVSPAESSTLKLSGFGLAPKKEGKWGVQGKKVIRKKKNNLISARAQRRKEERRTKRVGPQIPNG